jgi:hypothetical protein
MLGGGAPAAAEDKNDPATIISNETGDMEKQANEILEQMRKVEAMVPGKPDEPPPQQPAKPGQVAQPGKVVPGAPAAAGAEGNGEEAGLGEPQDMSGALAAMVGNGQLGEMQMKMLKLVMSEKFLKTAKDVWGSPDRPKVFIYQAAFFLFMLMIRAWQQSRVEHWFRRFLVGLACTVITWAGMAYFIPSIVIGMAYRDLLHMLYQTFFG